MAISIKSYLQRKKASKLPDDVREYIKNTGNNMKAVAILNIAYNLLSNKEDVTIDGIKKVTDIVDEVYKSEADKYVEKYLCYYKLVMNYLRFRDKNKLSEIAQIPYADTDNQYINKEAYLCHYHLIMINVPAEKRNLIARDLIEAANINSDLYQCFSIYRKIIIPFAHIGVYNNEISMLVNDVINSKFISGMLVSGKHLSIKSAEVTKKVLLKVISEDVDKYETDTNGFIIIQPKDSNYYKKYEGDFVNGKYCRNKAFVISDAQKYKKVLLGNNVIFQDKLCYRASFSSGTNWSGFNIEISCNTYVTETGEIKTVRGKGDYFRFYAYGKTEIFVSTRGRSRPATLSDLVKITRYSFVQGYIEKIIDDLSVEYPFFKDFKVLYRESLEYQTAVIPMSINDVFMYHNWNEYFRDKYKTAKELNYNFNKMIPRVSYTLIKTARYVKKADIGLLYNMLTQCSQIAAPDKDIEKHTIKGYYSEKLCGLDDDIYSLLEDWIMMSIKNKVPISLRLKSKKKIAEKHDDLMIALWEKQAKRNKNVVLVKEVSRFNHLREILPPEYEWITSSKRLMLESQMQRHCVWQYDKKIKADDCAIYSYVAPSGIRYTIEFGYASSGYFIKQMQKFGNRGSDKEFENNIMNLLQKK